MFVGSDGRAALREGGKFHRYVVDASEQQNNRLSPSSRLLDFGCGWGRMTRFMVQSVTDTGKFGVDVNSYMIDVCKKTNVPGFYSAIEKRGSLPFPDGFFTHIFAYSVFTHLPEGAAKHWLAELSRVAAPGCVFILTVEPPRFLEMIANADPVTATDAWPSRLTRRFHKEAVEFRKNLDRDGYAYFPSSGQEHADDYGDSVYTEDYMRRVWAPFFSVASYLDDPAKFWQAVAVLRKQKA
jgi:ubiquinone/menaquinone biosynthesis C-methylase UbiE